MEPQEFYDLALKLCKGKYPAEFRTAINRAYYFVYHSSVEFLEDLECGIRIPMSGSGHGEVLKYLGNCGDKGIIMASSQLKDLYSNRLKADYELQYSEVENSKTAETNIRVAFGIIEILQKSKKTNCELIIKTLIDYQKKVSGSS